jgi:NitT/TauT family transport system substrate-binding protein
MRLSRPATRAMNRLFATSFRAGRLAIAAGAALVLIRAVPAMRAGEAAAAEPAPVTLVLQWNHQAQFAGYYMALEKGLYRREGLDVRIRRGGPDVSTCEELGAGRADFCCTMLSTALEKRAAGLPLVLLAQIVSRSNFVLVAWKHPPGEPGATISQPADLAGRRVTVWEADYRTPYLAFFGAAGVQPEILPQYYTLSLFLHRGADACSAMRYNEYHRLMQHGVRPEDVVVFNLWEHGIALPEDGLYTLQKTWIGRPEVCRAFARASLAGWSCAREHPEQALALVMRYVDADNVPTNRPHMRWMLREILRSIFPEQGDSWTFGQLSPPAYARAVDLLVRHGNLQGAPAFGNFVTTEASHVVP